jgi:branched-chain amino acid transport system ATP-binding protein
LIRAHGLHAGYDGHAVVRDFSIAVRPGEVVVVLGPNGAGKTTTLRTLAGVIPALGGEVVMEGQTLRDPQHRRARRGIAYVAEGRTVFTKLTTAENLRLARCEPSVALDLFPELRPLLGRRAGLLSGGEQQIVSLARALARTPKLLLVDELSLGLAPIIVQRLLRAVRDSADRDGIGVVLVEQHVSQALKIADYAVVLRNGDTVLRGSAADVRERIADTYLPGGGEG